MKTDDVWVGKVEVSIPAACTLELTGAGAFVWCATQASDKETFLSKVGKMLAHYGLIPIDFEKVGPAGDLADPSDDLFEIISRAEEDPRYTLYGTFHSYPHHAS